MAELILLLLAGTAFLAGRLGWEPVGPGWRARSRSAGGQHGGDGTLTRATAG